MRQSVPVLLERGQWLPVEAGLFDLRNVGQVEWVEVLAVGRDHVLVEYRGQRHAILKRRGYIVPRVAPHPGEGTPPQGEHTPG